MPHIYDNIEAHLLEALKQTLTYAHRGSRIWFQTVFERRLHREQTALCLASWNANTVDWETRS